MDGATFVSLTLGCIAFGYMLATFLGSRRRDFWGHLPGEIGLSNADKAVGWKTYAPSEQKEPFSSVCSYLGWGVVTMSLPESRGRACSLRGRSTTGGLQQVPSSGLGLSPLAYGAAGYILGSSSSSTTGSMEGSMGGSESFGSFGEIGYGPGIDPTP